MTATDENTIWFNPIVEDLARRGIPAHVEMTGGGVATIYVGKPRKLSAESAAELGVGFEAGDEFYPAVIGPGTFRPGASYGSAHELVVGPDDDGDDGDDAFVIFNIDNPATYDKVVDAAATIYEDDRRIAAAVAEDERVKAIHSESFAAASNGEPYTDLAAEAVEVIRTVAAEHHAEEE